MFNYRRLVHEKGPTHEVADYFKVRTQLFDFTDQPKVSVNWFDLSEQELRLLFYVLFCFLQRNNDKVHALICYGTFFNYDLDGSDISLDTYKAFWEELSSFVKGDLATQLKPSGLIKLTIDSKSSFSLTWESAKNS